jgi:putative RNA 2'-phosphotransferase
MALNRKEIQRFAKFLSYVLGVRPDEFGLVPDPEGFVWIKDLLQALREEDEWRFLGRAHLAELLHAGFGQEFEIQEDRIRCRVPKGSILPEPVGSPPAKLYCAVRQRAHPVVLEKGLKPAKGPWVVLSRTPEMALRIGRRKDPHPVTLEVRAQQAAASGLRFHSTQGELFLVEEIPATFLVGPRPAQERKEGRASRRITALPTEPPIQGSFYPDPHKDMGLGPPRPSRRSKDPQWRRERRRGNKG